MGPGRKGKPPDTADTTLRRKIKRLWSHAEAAQAASKQARQAVVPGQEPNPGQNAAEAEDEDTALRRIVQGLHESSAKTAENRALRELRRDGPSRADAAPGPALPPALAAMQEERAQVARAARAAREMAQRPGPGENYSEADADTDLQRIVQGLHESATRTAENRAMRELRPSARADRAPQAPDGDDTDETTLGRIMKRLRVRTAATQAAWSAAGQARQAPPGAPAAPKRPNDSKAMQSMQAAHAQMRQAMQALQADGGAQAGARAKKDKKAGKKGGGFFARAFAALRGAERPRPEPAPADDSQMLRRVSPRELRELRGAPGLGEELEALGGGAILSRIGFDPSAIEYVQTSLGGGVVLMDLHSGPDWRIYHFMLGASPFWLLCPKAGAQQPRAGGDPRTREVVLVKKLKKALDAKN
jgi:hypothetical protein